MGSVVSKYVERQPGVPPFVALPYQLRNGTTPSPGQHGGLLGRAYDPFLVLRDPNAAEFRVDEIELPEDAADGRLDRRRSLLQQFDDQQRWVAETFAPKIPSMIRATKSQTSELATPMMKKPVA